MEAVDAAELKAAGEYLRQRLDRTLIADWDDDDFGDRLAAYLRERPDPPLLFAPERLPEIARLAAEGDPEEQAWRHEIADNAVAGKAYAASNAYCRRFVELPEDFDWTAFPHPDPQALHGLSRLRWFADLAHAYWLDRDPRYLEALMREWDRFARMAPLPEDPAALLRHCHGMPAEGAPWSPPAPWWELDCFIRLTNWYWAFWLSLYAGIDGDRVAVLLVRCLRLFENVAGRGIYNHKHNFTSMQLEAVYLWAASLPEVAGMPVWQHFARNTLESSLAAAVWDDGVHWEKSAGYHRGCICWYGTPYLLGQKLGDGWSPAAGDRLRRMGDFMDAIVTPDGNTSLISDSDRVGDWRAGLALVRSIFRDARFGHPVRPTYESIWRSGGVTWDADSVVSENVGGDLRAATIRIFRRGGVASVRTATSLLLVDNGPNGAWHAHKDNLTVHWDALGQPIIVDPGRAVYRGDTDRNWVTMPNSHNLPVPEDQPVTPHQQIKTCALGLIHDPDDPRLGPFVVNEQPDHIRLTTSFAGYAGDPRANVRRIVCVGRDDEAPWLLVVDRLQGGAEHNWTNSWLLPATDRVQDTPEGYTVTLDSGLHLAIACAAQTPLQIRDDAMFWCPNYAEKAPARWLRFSGRDTDAVRAFAFVPYRDTPLWPLLDLTDRSLTAWFGTTGIRIARR